MTTSKARVLTNPIAERARYEGAGYTDKNGRQQWRRCVLWDAKEPGLGLRLTPRTGDRPDSKTWVLTYRDQGQKRLMKLGPFPTVGTEAARRLAKAMKGRTVHANLGLAEDPLAARRRARDEQRREDERETVATLAVKYVERHAKPNKRSWRDDERILNKEVVPLWGTRPAEEVTFRDVEQLLNSIADRGALVQANRIRSLLSKMFTFGKVRPNPARDAEKPLKSEKERERERVLTDAEIRRLWTALDDAEPLVAASYRLRLLTAQRQHEIHHMRWRDVDAEGWWAIDKAWTKNKRSHRLFLSPEAVAELERIHALTGDCEWVFDAGRWRESSVRATSRRKDGRPAPPRGRPLGRLQYATGRIRTAASLANFRPHDLRRTAATLLTRQCGVSRLVVSRVLNHTEGGVTQVYDRHSYEPEMKAALEALGREVARILAAEDEGNVLPFKVNAR